MQDYAISIYLRQQWRDFRLQYPVPRNVTRQRIKLPDGIWEQLWTPDVFFRNEKQASYHTITTPNRLMHLYNDGTVWYVSK